MGSKKSRHSDTVLPRPPFETRIPVPQPPITEPRRPPVLDKLTEGHVMGGPLKVIGQAAAEVQLVGQAATGQTADIQEIRRADGVVLASFTAGGKLISADADVGFGDPNAHYQSNPASAQELLTELGWLLTDGVRSWLGAGDIFTMRAWNQTEAFYSGGDMYGRTCLDAADTTIAHKVLRIPKWYVAPAGGPVLVDLYWMAQTVPGVDEIVRIRVRLDNGFSPGDQLAFTTSDFSISVPSTVDNKTIYKTTLTLTTPAIDGGSYGACIAMYRRALSDAADTYAGTFFPVGIDVRSDVLSA